MGDALSFDEFEGRDAKVSNGKVAHGRGRHVHRVGLGGTHGVVEDGSKMGGYKAEF